MPAGGVVTAYPPDAPGDEPRMHVEFNIAGQSSVSTYAGVPR
jgi:hypothetical protein